MSKTPAEIRQLIEDYKQNPTTQPFKDDVTEEELLALEQDVRAACQSILQMIASSKQKRTQSPN